MQLVYLTAENAVVAVHAPDQAVPLESYAPNGATHVLSLPASAVVRDGVPPRQGPPRLADDWKAQGMPEAVRHEADRRRADLIGAASVQEMRERVSDAQLEGMELLDKKMGSGLTKKEEARAEELRTIRQAIKAIDAKVSAIIEAAPDDPTTDDLWAD